MPPPVLYCVSLAAADWLVTVCVVTTKKNSDAALVRRGSVSLIIYNPFVFMSFLRTTSLSLVIIILFPDHSTTYSFIIRYPNVFSNDFFQGSIKRGLWVKPINKSITLIKDCKSTSIYPLLHGISARGCPLSNDVFTTVLHVS